MKKKLKSHNKNRSLSWAIAGPKKRVNWKTGKQKRKWAGQTLSLSVWSKSEDADDEDDDDEVVAVAGDRR